MPRATVTQETVRRDLRSCPGGYVNLRTLSFHEMNMRQEMAARIYQEEKVPKKGQKRERSDTVRGYFELMNVAVTEYEFRNCITDHNLEDENGNPLDFTQPMRAWRLDPKIGQEISKYIDDLNQFEEEDEELAPLEMQPFSSSSDEKITSLVSTENE